MTTWSWAAEAARPTLYSSSCSGTQGCGPPSLAATTVPTNPIILEAPVSPTHGIDVYAHHSSAARDPGDLDMAEAPAPLVLLIVEPVAAARYQ